MERRFSSGGPPPRRRRDPNAPAPAVPIRPTVTAEGRVVAYPGAEVVVGTEVSGLIVRLPVEEKSVVKRGDMIAELRSDDLRASRAEAEARAAEADADIAFYERESLRERQLLARHSGTTQALDNHRRGLDAARARRLAALASRDRFDALIAKTRIVAPIDGVVLARHVHPGETLDAASRIVTIADLTRLRVEAEVDEFDTARVASGPRSGSRPKDIGPTGWARSRRFPIRWWAGR